MERDTEHDHRPDTVADGDTGMIGSETQEPGPGRDTAMTDPDPVAASTEQPRGTVAMSENDPLRTRLGAHVEGAGVIGHDVDAAERAADRPGYAAETADRAAAEPGYAAETADRAAAEPGYGAERPDREEEAWPAGGRPADVDAADHRPDPAGVDRTVYEREADEAKRQRPSGG